MKNVKVLALLFGIMTLGIAHAYAVPTIDGSISPVGEWDNNATYPYYLTFSDVNEALVPDRYDIKNVVLLQDLGNADPTKDGVYLLIETYAPASVVDEDAPADVPTYVTISMSGDFEGDGINDIFITQTCNDVNCTNQSVLVANPAGGVPYPGVPITDSANGDVLEYFFAAGEFGTPPNTPFPTSFIGTITYQGGGTSPDDITRGTLGPGGPNVIPEPGTMMLLSMGLIGFVGRKKILSH